MTVNITCGACKHDAPMDDFRKHRSQVRLAPGPLPQGEFQCPKCKRAVRIVKTPVEIFEGKVYSKPNQIVPIQSRL